MPKKKMYKRPDGLYEKKLTINGKRKVFRGHTEREVLQKIADYQETAEKGRFFEVVAAEWWEVHQTKLKYGSLHTYKSAMNRAVDYFKGTRINEITAPEVYAFLLFVAQHGYAHKTVKNQLTVVKQVFLYALMNREIKELPTVGVAVPSGLSQESRSLAPDDVVKAVKAIKPDEFILPALILYTGARCGEALALQWKDFDFISGLVFINKAVVYHSNQPVISDTKTKNAVRCVPLLDPLRVLLEAQTPHSADDYIIGGAFPVTKSVLNTNWLNFCRAHDLAHINEQRTARAGKTIWTCNIDRHTLRHEYATILYEAGIQPRTAQELLGHADLKTTLDIYTHIRQNQLSQTSDKINDFLNQKSTVKAQ